MDEILDQLKSALRLEIEVLDGVERVVALLKGEPSIRKLSANGQKVTCRFSGSREELPTLHQQIVAAEIPLVSFATRTDNLEDIYMKLSGHQVS